jgi:hypothetical protein
MIAKYSPTICDSVNIINWHKRKNALWYIFFVTTKMYSLPGSSAVISCCSEMGRHSLSQERGKQIWSQEAMQSWVLATIGENRYDRRKLCSRELLKREGQAVNRYLRKLCSRELLQQEGQADIISGSSAVVHCRKQILFQEALQSWVVCSERGVCRHSWSRKLCSREWLQREGQTDIRYRSERDRHKLPESVSSKVWLLTRKSYLYMQVILHKLGKNWIRQYVK